VKTVSVLTPQTSTPISWNFFVVPGKILEFCWTNKSEIGRVKEENQPFTLETRLNWFFGILLMKHFKMDIRYFLADDREDVSAAFPAATHIILHRILI
jgi:hypothetical protein